MSLWNDEGQSYCTNLYQKFANFRHIDMMSVAILLIPSFGQTIITNSLRRIMIDNIVGSIKKLTEAGIALIALAIVLEVILVPM